MPVILPHRTTLRASKYFTRAEFACPCCNQCFVDTDFLKILHAIRESIGVPLRVASGYRCNRHNDAIGGSKHSQHRAGKAADIVPVVDDDAQAFKRAQIVYLAARHKLSVGFYDKHIHLDSRHWKQAAFWTGQSK